MFAHISGVVAEKNADSIVIDAGGIGFLLNVSAATLSAAPATGEKFKLYTIFNVREDAMELCGFATREEKRMYERLRSVGGVGSKLALSVLSSLSVHAADRQSSNHHSARGAEGLSRGARRRRTAAARIYREKGRLRAGLHARRKRRTD